MCFATALTGHCEAQNSPVVKVHAYQREVVGGIPSGPPGVGTPARQTRYFIYLETPPQATFIVDGVWMGGQFYSVATAVKTAPVRFESPVTMAQDEKNIAVPATANTVTEIVLREPIPGKTPDSNVARMLGDVEAVIQLSYAGKPVLMPVKTFEKREPLYMR